MITSDSPVFLVVSRKTWVRWLRLSKCLHELAAADLRGNALVRADEARAEIEAELAGDLAALVLRKGA